MNIIKRHIEYLKNNPEGYWFKRKLYGWGWTPATWQGWLTLALFIGIFVWFFVPMLSNPNPSPNDILLFVLKTVAWVATLIGVCYVKGEPPAWQWGLPNDSKDVKDEKGV